MKKIIALTLALLALLSIVGCGGISRYLTEENGMQYLILPISRERVRVWEQYESRVGEIDVDLLRAAEKTLNERCAAYSEKAFCLSTDEAGNLCLCYEVIVEKSDYEKQDSPIDHKHVFFRERITK
jgi:hypothetical protein